MSRFTTLKVTILVGLGLGVSSQGFAVNAGAFRAVGEGRSAASPTGGVSQGTPALSGAPECGPDCDIHSDRRSFQAQGECEECVAQRDPSLVISEGQVAGVRSALLQDVHDVQGQKLIPSFLPMVGRTRTDGPVKTHDQKGKPILASVFGSNYLVSPCYGFMDAHVVFGDDSPGSRFENGRFVYADFGQRPDGSFSHPNVKGRAIGWGSSKGMSAGTHSDWALVHFRDCPGTEVGWLPYAAWDPSANGVPAIPVGYPASVATVNPTDKRVQMHDPMGKMYALGYSKFEITHSGILRPGMSGGPMVTPLNGVLTVIGTLDGDDIAPNGDSSFRTISPKISYRNANRAGAVTYMLSGASDSVWRKDSNGIDVSYNIKKLIDDNIAKVGIENPQLPLLRKLAEQQLAALPQ